MQQFPSQQVGVDTIGSAGHNEYTALPRAAFFQLPQLVNESFI
ncbi:hypothetical protein [Sphingobium lactosutens]|uniref:Uncharacterized protein n=1 Tax=Sphingobium lactosutens DS20 TaxID=1331060 RepID=T0IND9_9SPHN|nr:hypothetical protein [Sphingobium lactosutens]EQB11169.1 hypothetical protein RLDS_25065 [Sphingobium lactosutens DS20]